MQKQACEAVDRESRNELQQKEKITAMGMVMMNQKQKQEKKKGSSFIYLYFCKVDRAFPLKSHNLSNVCCVVGYLNIRE